MAACRVKGCRAHCRGCDRCFGGVHAFDMHQIGTDPVACHTPSARGLVFRDGVWGRPTPERLRLADPATEMAH